MRWVMMCGSLQARKTNGLRLPGRALRLAPGPLPVGPAMCGEQDQQYAEHKGKPGTSPRVRRGPGCHKQ
ncbi:hypothetical protein GCM10010424_08840 [Streptomyces lienomycini]